MKITEILNYIRTYIIKAAIFSALVNILYIAPTIYMLQVYDRVVPTRGFQTLFFLTLILIFALATLAFLDRARMRLLARASVNMERRVAPAVLDTSLGRPQRPSLRQALREFDALRATLTGPAVLALFDAPWIPIYLVICFLVHPWIGLLATVSCGLLPLVAVATVKATQGRTEEAQQTANTSYASQDALLNAGEAIRALGMRRALVARQLRHRETMIATQTKAGLSAGNFLALSKFIRLALQSLALGLAALLAIENQISAGAIFAASFLIARALQPIEQLIAAWKPLIQARRHYQDIAALLSTETASNEKTLLPPPTGHISVESVGVANERRDGSLLTNISFSVAAGEIVAVIGPSGAGKSTLIRTLAGAELPDRGTIRFDGADYRGWDPERLASHVGYLPQDAMLLSGSVSDNIARFSRELQHDKAAVDAAVVAAASLVGADALIRRLPDGYDHQLKLGGRGVSAGQAQRIALARAVFGDPAILILDEPNAHLDTEGDAAFIMTLGKLKAQGRTIIIVSHKSGILPLVDKILVMRDGRVDIFGPRDQVLAKMSPTGTRSIGMVSIGQAAR